MLEIMLLEVLLFHPAAVKSATGFKIYHYANSGVVAKTDAAWMSVSESEEQWIRVLVPQITTVHFVKSYSKPPECDKQIKFAVINSPGIGWDVYIDPEQEDIEMAFRLLISSIRENSTGKVLYYEGCRN